jgi:hypothetical protein
MASRGHRFWRVAVRRDLRFFSSRAPAQGLIFASERLLSLPVSGITGAICAGILTVTGLICRKIDTCAGDLARVAGRGVVAAPEKKI